MSDILKVGESITITRPDDWHVHLRDIHDGKLDRVITPTQSTYGRALVMPNLTPPVVNTQLAHEYHNRIMNVVTGSNFSPLMAIYLTDTTSVEEVQRAKNSGVVLSFKLYPAGATTNSDSGVTDIKKIYPVLEEMQKLGVPLNIHGEVTHHDVDIFDREKYFLSEVLLGLRNDFPELKIVLEHITTKEAVNFVLADSGPIAATITPQHLWKNRNDMLVGGIKPHLYCLPILKTMSDQQSLIAVATSGDPRFFLGTDSAPHFKGDKESACGCAGCFSPDSLEIYATIFEEHGALDMLEGFASHFGADFYGLPRNKKKVTLTKSEPHTIPSEFAVGDNSIVPLGAGEELSWLLSMQK